MIFIVEYIYHITLYYLFIYCILRFEILGNIRKWVEITSTIQYIIVPTSIRIEKIVKCQVLISDRNSIEKHKSNTCKHK